MKKICVITGLGCMLLASSCLRDGIEGEKSNPAALSVTVNLDRLGSESATRVSVAPEDGEENVNTLYLYFFEATDDQSGKFVDCIELEGPLSMNCRYQVPTAGTRVDVTNAYNIVAIANIADNHYIPGEVETWNTLWNDRTEAYFRIHAVAEITGATDESDDSRAIASDWILMHGITTKKAMDGNISLTLTRNVARFDVINSVDGSYDLMSVSIWNGYTRSSITGDGVPDYSMTPGQRTERFYGVDNSEDTETGTYGDIKGRLYAFENKVVSPVVNDRYTTCLIIGLRNKASEEIGYYRVNVHPEESPQNLKRNNVYRVTLIGVTGEGASTESDAYAGTTTELIYVINYWDLDDNGMIVSDQHSILAVPVKTVRIGAGESTNYYTITTFSTLQSPAPLMIRSQIYEPSTGRIEAHLNGNLLTIHAQPMEAGEEDRTGIVTLTYAGLEASINIVQSHSVDTYLEVTFEENWSSTLGPQAGIRSEDIHVRASGPWTAELFGEGFSLNSNTGGSPVTLLKSESLPPANHEFCVYTHSQNTDAEIRKAFVLISLDKDPVNYVAVVTLYQKPLGTINILPDTDFIAFDGSGTMTSHPANTVFEVSSSSGNQSLGYTLQGEDSGKFIVELNTAVSPAELTVKTKEVNASGETYSAILSLTDAQEGTKLITLRQTSLSLAMSPTSFGTVPVTGGETELIALSTGSATSKWTAEIIVETNSPGKTLINHGVHFVDEAGNILDVSQPQGIEKKFRIVFSKVYFPNREMDIIATVKVSIEGSSLTRTFTINQIGLYARTVTIWNCRNLAYGALGEHYHIAGYSSALKSLGYSWTDRNYTDVTTGPPAHTNYIHMGNQYMAAGFNWNEIENFRTEKDGILMLMGDVNTAGPLAALNSSESPLGKNGYTVATPKNTSSSTARLANGIQDTRIGKFLTVNGVTALDPTINVTTFYINGVRTELTSWPQSAMPVVVESVSPERVIMAIDPENRMVYLGECQIFGASHEIYANGRIFMNNYIEYVIQTAKYGSHFTDMLREDLAGAIPEMWDNVWGQNKWPY